MSPEWETILQTAGFAATIAGSIAASSKWVLSRAESRADRLEEAMHEEARELRSAMAEKLDSVTKAIHERFEMNAKIFNALRENVEKLGELGRDHEARIYHLQEMSQQWLEGRLHPRNGRGGG